VRVVVEDAGDPRLDLTRADRRPDRPGRRGLVLAEGVPVVRRLLDSPYPLRAVLGVPARVDDLAADLSTVDAPVDVASADTMAAVVGFHVNRGVLAAADRAPVLADVLGSARRLVVCEGVNDHENSASSSRPRGAGILVRMQKYVGSMLAVILGLAVDLTAGKLGLYWWYLVAIGAVTILIAWLVRPRQEPAPVQTRSVVKGNLGANSAIRRARVRGADHVLDGDMGDGGNIEDVDFR
jgi:hypothetical protein